MVGGGVKLSVNQGYNKSQTLIANYYKSYDTVGSRPFVAEIYEI